MDSNAILDLHAYVAALKAVPRTGWTLPRLSIPDAEHVADHSYGVAMLATLLAPATDLDVARCVRIALVHDLGEAITGDIVTGHGRLDDAKAKAGKSIVERAALDRILVHDKAGRAFAEEYLTRSSPEARFVSELDKLEAALQALAYERAHDRDLTEIFEYADARIAHPLVRQVFEEARRRRPR